MAWTGLQYTQETGTGGKSAGGKGLSSLVMGSEHFPVCVNLNQVEVFF